MHVFANDKRKRAAQRLRATRWENGDEAFYKLVPFDPYIPATRGCR